MTGRTVSAVIFDWGGTLTPFHSISKRAIVSALARVVPPEAAEPMVPSLQNTQPALGGGCMVIITMPVVNVPPRLSAIQLAEGGVSVFEFEMDV